MQPLSPQRLLEKDETRFLGFHQERETVLLSNSMGQS